MASIKQTGTVTKDKHGIYWANFRGKRITPNRLGVAWDLLHDLEDAYEREQIAAGNPNLPSLQGIEVIALRGVPGSGKTTWAKHYVEEYPWYKRICKDDLRTMFDGGVYSSDREVFIRTARSALIRACLEDGYSVVIDDTNLHRKDIADIYRAAHVYSHVIGVQRMVAVPVRVIDIETPLDVCIERDAQRENPVGAERICELYDRHLRAMGKLVAPNPVLMEQMREALARVSASRDQQ